MNVHDRALKMRAALELLGPTAWQNRCVSMSCLGAGNCKGASPAGSDENVQGVGQMRLQV